MTSPPAVVAIGPAVSLRFGTPEAQAGGIWARQSVGNRLRGMALESLVYVERMSDKPRDLTQKEFASTG
jgi:hypothetical protein